MVGIPIIHSSLTAPGWNPHNRTPSRGKGKVFMTPVSKEVKQTPNRRLSSINACLLVLGAPKKEVYRNTNSRRPKMPCRASRLTLYTQFSRQELFDWATHLYREALKKLHPDHHRENEKYYTQRCQELGEAYLRAEQILVVHTR